MPSKAEFYRQMAEQVSTRLVGSWQEWTAFLSTAARLYKYPFHEQMMIYAQRPDATACAEYDLWNDKMGRYVRRGSKGIALVDDSGDRPRLRYVFDISDTGTREHSRTPWLWQLEEQHIGPVSAMLERNYGIAGDDLAQQLTDVAGKLASEYWNEHQQDFRYIVDGSFLEEYDDLDVGVQFKSAATVSIAYALMSRCGLEPERYFQHEDFMSIFDFNIPATVGALGAAVSQINQQVLRQIGVTVQHYEREQLAERSVTYATFEWLSKYIGKMTERTKSQSIGRGSRGSSSDSYQLTARDLCSPDEIRRMDDGDCLVLLRSEPPVIDHKFDLMRHPNVKLTPDGGAAPYRMPDDYAQTAQTISPDVVTGLTEPAITEVMYDEIQKIMEEIHNEQERNL